MSTADVSVGEAPDRDDLTSHREHCAVDPGTLAAIDRRHKQQVRVVRGPDRAIYTVVDAPPDPPPGAVLMGRGGLQRFGSTATFAAVIDAAVTRDLSEADAARDGELVERLCDDGAQRRLIAIAPHGGEIEPHTDEQAERVRTSLAVSSWLCRGFDGTQGAVVRWHITAADIDPASFPRLDSVMPRRFRHAVAFHGMKDEGVLVGGGRGGAALQKEIADEIRRIPGVDVRLADPADVLGGNAPSNIVNLLTATGRGVQIEQSRRVRDEHWRAVADAVAAVYRRHLSTTPALR
jgi:phage replication-related protein YjqB (UPF0714/DUF867 family)